MSQSQVSKISRVRSVKLAMRHPNLTVLGRNTGLETQFTRRKLLNFNFDPSSGAVLGKYYFFIAEIPGRFSSPIITVFN